MALSSLKNASSREVIRLDPVPTEGLRYRSWTFQHHDLIRSVEGAKPVSQQGLINLLNYAHFMERPILVHLRHSKYKEEILLRAHPDPYLGKELVCKCSNGHLSALELSNYQFLHIIVDDGRCVTIAPIQSGEIDGNWFKILLQKTSFTTGQRQTRRFACKDVTAELYQSGFFASGEMLDFSPVGFRVRVRPAPHCSFHWFNSDEVVSIHLQRNNRIFFSGTCRCIRQLDDIGDREMVLSPLTEKINRFKESQIRNVRQQLRPKPALIFFHPFLKKRVQLEVHDICTSGFSVYERRDDGVLIHGMIIPELTIDFSGEAQIRCTAQVIDRSEENDNGILCDLAVLDMNIDSCSRLTHILTNASDPHAYISNSVDMDELWKFFFETGFIYPGKYLFIHSRSEDFKETYRKIYQENPEIARHITYQENGRIYGHISMIRAYSRTWMIHHYATKAMNSRRTGFVILKHLIRYLYSMCRLPSAKMDYVMCYFRPQNKFPDRIFGGFARALDNPKGCSMDLFAYVPYTSLALRTEIPKGWLLNQLSAKDLWELTRVYARYSNGMLLQALGLGRNVCDDESLEEVFGKFGFVRSWQAYSLCHSGELKSVLILNQSDGCLNLSELLNCVQILVTNPKDMPWDILSAAIGQLASEYHKEEVPILLYPFHYVGANGIPFEKQYQLWILNVRFGHEYMEYMQNMFKMGYR